MEGNTSYNEGQYNLLSAEETDELLRDLFANYTETLHDGGNVMTFESWINLIYDFDIHDERVTQVKKAVCLCTGGFDFGLEHILLDLHMMPFLLFPILETMFLSSTPWTLSTLHIPFRYK
jgi:hypothetical protein